MVGKNVVVSPTWVKLDLLQKNNTNLPQFWGFFVVFCDILVDQKSQIGYTVYTVAKRSNK